MEKIVLRIPHLGDQSLQNINSKVSNLLEEVLESEKKLQEPSEKLLKWYELHSKRTEQPPIVKTKKEKDKKQKDLKTFKIALLGQRSVVKQFCNKFLTNYFVSDSKLTIGVDFWVKNVNLKEINYKLDIWQLSGEEQFRHLLPMYLRGTQGAIIMYDIPNTKTSNEIAENTEMVRKNAGDIPIYLAFTEISTDMEQDLEHVFELLTENYTYTDISSKMGKSLEYTFALFTEKILEHVNL